MTGSILVWAQAWGWEQQDPHRHLQSKTQISRLTSAHRFSSMTLSPLQNQDRAWKWCKYYLFAYQIEQLLKAYLESMTNTEDEL